MPEQVNHSRTAESCWPTLDMNSWRGAAGHQHDGGLGAIHGRTSDFCVRHGLVPPGDPGKCEKCIFLSKKRIPFNRRREKKKNALSHPFKKCTNRYTPRSPRADTHDIWIAENFYDNHFEEL